MIETNEKPEKITIYASNKSNEIIMYNETKKQVITESDEFKCGKLMLKVFDVGWVKVGEL